MTLKFLFGLHQIGRPKLNVKILNVDLLVLQLEKQLQIESEIT